MATKSKSNVAKSAKKSSFKFKWWMAVIGIAIIALIGVVVVRLSHASATITYNANQFASLPGFYTSNAKLSTYNFGKGNVPVYYMPKNNSVIGSQLQLFSGNYVVCVWGRGLTGGNSGLMNVIITKTSAAGPQQFKNTTSTFTNTNPSICVAFNNIGATVPNDLQVSTNTENGAVINAITIEAR